VIHNVKCRYAKDLIYTGTTLMSHCICQLSLCNRDVFLKEFLLSSLHLIPTNNLDVTQTVRDGFNEFHKVPNKIAER